MKNVVLKTGPFYKGPIVSHETIENYFFKSLDKMGNICYNIIKIREGKPIKPDRSIL